MGRVTLLIYIIFILALGVGTGYLVSHHNKDKSVAPATTAIDNGSSAPNSNLFGQEGTPTDPRGGQALPGDSTPTPTQAPVTAPKPVTNPLQYSSNLGVSVIHPTTWKVCPGGALFTGNDQTCGNTNQTQYGVTLTEEVALEKAYPTLALLRAAIEQSTTTGNHMLYVPGNPTPIFGINDSQDNIFNGVPVTQIGENVPGTNINRLGVYFVVSGKLLKLTYFTNNGHAHRTEAYDLIASMQLGKGAVVGSATPSVPRIGTPAYTTPYTTPAQGYPY